METIAHYRLDEIKSMPTLRGGHWDNLKVDTGEVRVWLSRMTIADGMPYDNQVKVEQIQNGVWVETETYEAR